VGARLQDECQTLSKTMSTKNGREVRQEHLSFLKILFIADFFSQQNCKKDIEKKDCIG